MAEGAVTAKPAKEEPAKEKAKTTDKEIDDAVLQMAMAMTEEEPESKAKVEEEEGFDFNILVTAFWSFLIIYSFGSSFIALTQGRVQDRTGGEFTLYDFFDNIFAFKEWSWEYTLGFNPIKLFDQLTGKPPVPDLDL